MLAFTLEMPDDRRARSPPRIVLYVGPALWGVSADGGQEGQSQFLLSTAREVKCRMCGRGGATTECLCTAQPQHNCLRMHGMESAYMCVHARADGLRHERSAERPGPLFSRICMICWRGNE